LEESLKSTPQNGQFVTLVFSEPGASVCAINNPTFPLQRGQRIKNTCASAAPIKGMKKIRCRKGCPERGAKNIKIAKASQATKPISIFLRLF
jgi:hypothetical protein